ncbi:hypothetical protein ABZ446_08020 [Streptomyces sp. NPDC005813]|uniref:hypothetical protein n=1 Tax=Streptomyces sp. NPDC005813 TaxID=3155592 RepID=UPI00340F7B56
MSTASGEPSAQGPGALLLCRAHPASVGPAARLLHERMLLAGAGPEWSVLVPEGGPWRHGTEPVDRVLTAWAAALAVSTPWPVLALWWDADRSGCTLASGFRRPVGYEWLADGTPAGEDEAMRTFAARLGLDPVLDMQDLEHLTKPDPGADGHARVRALLAVLARTGLAVPAGLGPGVSVDRLREVARILPGAERTDRDRRSAAVRAEPGTAEDGVPGPWLRGTRARVLASAEVGAGLPLTAWGVRRRSAGWIAAGALLTIHGALGLAYDRLRAFD